jgi:hypothetical protein
MRRALIFVFGLTAGATAARAQTVTIRPAGDLSSLVDMPLDVPIVADWRARLDKLGAFALRLQWDPAILRFEGGTNGTFGQITSNTDSTPQGVLRLSGANPNGANGMITLGIGRFTPLDTVGTTLQLQVTELYATAPTFAPVPDSAQNALYCAARGLWGDADGDGTVGSRDALLALSSAVGLDVSAFPGIGLADVDTSGAVDARDALVILSYAVGMDVSGFRLHTLALGSCGSAVQTTYAILPGADTLVQGQDLRLTLNATSTLGAVRTLTDVFWRSSNPTVMAVMQDGRAIAAGAGVVTLVGKSGTRDSAVTTMTVVTRRSHHVVDAAAISAANRIGSAALPFASLAEAAGITAEGDTVFVHAGHYADPGFFSQGVVILGQSGAGGVVLSTGQAAAISFFNGRRGEVHNVTIDNTNAGVEAFGLDTLVVDSLTYTAAAGTCVSEAVGSSDIRQLVVRRSTLTGDGVTGCTTGIDAFGVVQDLTVDRVVFSDLGNDAVYAGAADSVTVRRSTFHDLGSYAINVDALSLGGGRLPQPTSLALVVDSSHFARVGNNSAVYAYDLRSALMTHSAVVGEGYVAVRLSGVGTPGGYARLVDDSLLATGYNNWLDAYALDSVAIDSVVASGNQAYFSNVTALRATRSRITVTQSGTGLYVQPIVAGGTLVADSVTITGDPAGCPQCAEGIYAQHIPGAVSHFTGSNLNYALEFYDSTVSVTHATITDTYEAVYLVGPCCGAPAPTATVRDLTTVNTQYPVEISDMVFVGDSLSLSAGYDGIYTYGAGADTLRNSMIADFQYPVDLEGDTLYAAGNTILRPTYDGIEMYGNNNAVDTAVVSGNTVTCSAAGATNTDAIYMQGANAVVSGNSVTGCASGVYISSSGFAFTAEIRANVITAPANATDAAIHVTPPSVATIVGNQIRGGGHSGAIWLQGFSYSLFGHARVDSNTILNVADRAIWADYVDTLNVRGNLIDTVTNSGYYGSGPVGIGLANGGAIDSLERNTIRHAARGVEINIVGVLASLDSNAISATDSAAVWVDYGQVTMTGNHIANNRGDGLRDPGDNATTHVLQGNAFVNNALYAVNSPIDQVIAQQNWWGDAAGANTPLADSVFGTVDFSNPLTTDPTPSLPPLAPPVRVIAARSTTAARSLPVRTYVAPARTARAAPAPVAANARQATLADRMAAVTGDSRVARAVAQRGERLRARTQADAVRAQERAERAATQLQRQRQAEAARAARAARTPSQKGRAGQ